MSLIDDFVDQHLGKYLDMDHDERSKLLAADDPFATLPGAEKYYLFEEHGNYHITNSYGIPRLGMMDLQNVDKAIKEANFLGPNADRLFRAKAPIRLSRKQFNSDLAHAEFQVLAAALKKLSWIWTQAIEKNKTGAGGVKVDGFSIYDDQRISGKICGSCSGEMKLSARFCPDCGHEFSGETIDAALDTADRHNKTKNDVSVSACAWQDVLSKLAALIRETAQPPDPGVAHNDEKAVPATPKAIPPDVAGADKAPETASDIQGGHKNSLPVYSTMGMDKSVREICEQAISKENFKRLGEMADGESVILIEANGGIYIVSMAVDSSAIILKSADQFATVRLALAFADKLKAM